MPDNTYAIQALIRKCAKLTGDVEAVHHRLKETMGQRSDEHDLLPARDETQRAGRRLCRLQTQAGAIMHRVVRNRELILVILVPVLLALASLLAGWAMSVLPHSFRGWAPSAAFLIAGALFLLAIALGVPAVGHGG